MSMNRSSLELSEFKLTVLSLSLKFGEGPVDNAEVNVFDVWNFKDHKRYADLTFLDHEWALLVKVGAKEIRNY